MSNSQRPRVNIRQRSRKIAVYVSSSSAKRRERKDTHCFFCCRNFVNARDLEDHLNNSEACLACYCRKLKVKSLDGILINQFGCFFCNVPVNIKLAFHLQRNERCLQGYIDRFNVNDIRYTFYFDIPVLKC